jgi:Lrp/AsnC family transcriptional regulator, regulator for asnA, asnC and gidA
MTADAGTDGGLAGGPGGEPGPTDGGPAGAAGGEPGPLEGAPTSDTPDPPDRAIIEVLRRDGRRPYGAIAEQVGLSEAAVRRRVQRLRETGVIRIVAVVDPARLGLRRQAMVGVRTEGDVRPVASRLGALGGVERVVLCAGSFDVLVEVRCEDDAHLLDLVCDSIRSIPGVRSTETFVYLERVRQASDGGTP